MNRTLSHGSKGGASIRAILAAVLIAAVALAGWAWIRPKPVQEDRAALYRKSVAEGAVLAVEPAKSATPAAAPSSAWPATPHAVIEAFWQAAAVKDYARMTLLCPGSKTEDFKQHYDRWTPSPVRRVGAAAPHPQEQGVQLYPAVVDFPGFNGKTIKMALRKLPDGRWVIDGRHTIWW